MKHNEKTYDSYGVLYDDRGRGVSGSANSARSGGQRQPCELGKDMLDL
jgi:hypothetical protein